MQFRRLNTLTARRCTAGFRFLVKMRFSRNYGGLAAAMLTTPNFLAQKFGHMSCRASHVGNTTIEDPHFSAMKILLHVIG